MKSNELIEQSSPVKKFTVKFLQMKEVARETLSFQFDLQGRRFEFLPGQFVTLSLPDRNDLGINDQARTFSIASSPEERHLMVATRMTGSDFKRALGGMQRGDTAQIEGPDGRFVFDTTESTPVIFLAGGIGITPFRSMIRFALDRKLSHHILLVYSNRTPLDAAFLDELERWAGRLSNFRLLTTMTQPERSSTPWNGETRCVDAAFLVEHCEELARAECYTAGPPRFVKAMKMSLRNAGVAKERIHAEEFPGY